MGGHLLEVVDPAAQAPWCWVGGEQGRKGKQAGAFSLTPLAPHQAAHVLTSGAVSCLGPGGCCRRRWKYGRFRGRWGSGREPSVGPWLGLVSPSPPSVVGCWGGLGRKGLGRQVGDPGGGREPVCSVSLPPRAPPAERVQPVSHRSGHHSAALPSLSLASGSS